MTEKNKPEIKFRAGAVCATVWKNPIEKDGKTFDNFSVSVERGYKDKNDEWKNTGSMRISDIPKASLVLQKAYEYLVISNNESEQ